MSTNDFALAISKIRSIESDALISSLQEIFTLVARLNKEEVVAGYQMLGLLAEAFQGDAGQLYIKHLRQAMMVRMQALVLESDILERRSLITVFERVTNEEFKTR